MAKNNNKGFSLLEIVIAITILTLLLTPILQQLAQTMSTNRKTKEQQYANENAEYVLQYMQATPQEDIATKPDADIYRVNDEATIEANRQCKIYYIDASGSLTEVYDNSLTAAVVDYKTYTYRVNDVELGPKNTVYNRMVVMDDLSVKVSAFTDKDGKAYRVSYNNTAAPTGFELTDEGCIVQYSEATGEDINGDGDDDKYISAIVCDQYSGTASTNPNELNIGNMHDLDASKMALINGYATEYDAQARNDFYMELIELYKSSTNDADIKTLQQEHAGNGGISTTNFTENVKKLTVLHIEKNDTEKRYEVSLQVVYEGNLSTKSGTMSKFVHKEYDAWSQVFPYDSASDPCPEIYWEYQPYSPETLGGGDVSYVSEDYIVIDSKVDDAKIYLYKPTWHYAISSAYKNSSNQSIVDNLENNDNFYTKNDYSNDPDHELYTIKTKINIVSANLVDLTADPKFMIYTNLNIDDDRALDAGAVDPAITPQFSFETSAYSSYFEVYAADGTSTARTVYPIKLSYIKTIGEEESKDNRLFTVTVTLTPEDETCNTVTFTGAKGAN